MVQSQSSRKSFLRVALSPCLRVVPFTSSFATALKLAILLAAAIAFPALALADGPCESRQLEFKLPLGIPAEVWSYFVPKDNPLTREKVELGRQLFFDKRLSADGQISCATCHEPSLAFTDGKRVAEGIGGRRGARNTPTLFNAMFNTAQFWDGRTESLEEQAKLPLINPDEMGNQTFEQVVARVGAVAEYAEQFKKVFGSPVTIDSIAKAIATFERTLIAGNSPLDRYMAGNRDALSESARNGMILFRGKARCTICHTFNQSFASFPFLTDMNYRNTGVGANFRDFNSLARRAIQLSRSESRMMRDALTKEEGASEMGRFLLTSNALDIGAFRTPSLRNVELTAPYFHDGSAATLMDVVRFYVKGGQENLNRDWQLEAVDLTEGEQRDLVEFLKSLTSDDVKQSFEPSRIKPRP